MSCLAGGALGDVDVSEHKELRSPESSPSRVSWFREYLPALALTWLAFGLFIWRVDAKSLWWDESLSLYRAQRSVAYVLSNRIHIDGLATIDQHPPLYFLLLHLWIRLTGETDLALRWLSVAFGTLISPLLYVSVRYFAGRRAAFIAGLLGAISPFYLWYAQETRMYTMVTVLGLGANYTLWRALATHRIRWWVLYAFCMMAALATHYLATMLVFYHWAIVATVWYSNMQHSRGIEKRKRCRILLWMVAGEAIAVLSVGLYMLFRLKPPEGVYNHRLSLIALFLDVLNSCSLGLSVKISTVLPLDLVFGGVFALDVILSPVLAKGSMDGRRLREQTSEAQGFLMLPYQRLVALYFILPILAIWAISWYVPFYGNSRHAIVGSPGFYMGLALGLDRLFSWRKGLGGLVALVIFAGIAMSTYRYFFCDYYQTKENYRGVAQEIMEEERLGDLVIVNGPESLTAFEHYYRGNLAVWALPPVGFRPTRVADQLEEALQRYDRIWVVQGRRAFSDPNRWLIEWLNDHAMLLSRKGFESCGYYLALRTYGVLDPAKAPEANTEALAMIPDRLALTDYELRYRDVWGEERSLSSVLCTDPQVSACLPAARGQNVALRLSWLTLGPLDDYKLSLRLERDGHVWAQHDTAPFLTWPTSEWPRGKVVSHVCGLLIPCDLPPGMYALTIRVYEQDTGEPLSFAGPRGTSDSWQVGMVPVGVTEANAARCDLGEPEPDRCMARFGGQLCLISYTDLPEAIQPGQDLELQWTWRALEGARPDLVAILQWEDVHGTVWGQRIVESLGTGYPTDLWPEGIPLRGIVTFQVPSDAPLGRHRLHLLVGTRDGSLLSVGRGWLVWAGRDLVLGRVDIVESN